MKKKASIKIQEQSPQQKTTPEKRNQPHIANSEENIRKKRKIEKKNKTDGPKNKEKDKSLKKSSKFVKSDKKGDPTTPKSAKPKKLPIKGKTKTDGKPTNKGVPEKVTDWIVFKKQKKELRLKRIQARSKDNFDRIQQAKQMGEKVRLKNLKEDERNKVINQLHGLLKGDYAKFVLAHDMARIVQWLLKYSSDIVVHQISQELIPVVVDMLQSKYGIYCVKRCLKYGQDDIRTSIIDQFKGHAVKLVSHTLSAPIVEYGVSLWANNSQKQFLIQEFYGDLYRNSKDPNVKHLRDVYKDNESMKAATLGACKANIMKVLNKGLLDSGLVQSVICQFLQECSAEDKAELISEVAQHIVVISNSKDGSRAAMQCIWHGTNKDRKVIMKVLKEHLVELSKHENGHFTIIALLDSVDDTVLLHKLILSEILGNAKDLAVNEWGRKVLLWLIAPTNSTVFHPNFTKELTEGRESSSCKKSIEARRDEILKYSISDLLSLVIEDTKFWLSNASLAIEMLVIIKAGNGDTLQKALSKIVEIVTDIEWRIKNGENEILAIEDAGFHMILKKLAQHDKVALENGKPTFGKCLVDSLNDKVIEHWSKTNRGCFILVAVFENNAEETQQLLKSKLKPHLKLLQAQSTPGAKILLKKL